VAGHLTTLTGKPVDPNQKFPSRFEQSLILVGVPNQGIYWQHTLDRAAVAVGEEVPFKISIVEPKVPLVQNGSMNLKVVAERKPDFKAPITVQMLFNPPGVGSASSVVIPENQTEALYPINANGGAQVRKWRIAILGTAAVGNGPAWVSSQLATLEVAPPFVAFALERAASEQGKNTEMHCKVQVGTPFAGAAKVQLIGLPNKVTTVGKEITKDTKDFSFPLTIDKASPPGQHRNLFCQVVVVQNGEPILHNVGSGELRIDVPLPPKANAPPPPPMPVAQKPAAPMEKRLSRLEKLRLEQEEREKAAKAGGAAPKK
jgi:hypothetical protein